MKQLLLAATLLAAAVTVQAQHERSAFTATGRGGVATTFVYDYQAIGINPSNLGWGTGHDEKKGAIGFNEMSYSLYSEALGKQELRSSIRNFTDEDFTVEEKQQAANLFADAELAVNVDAMLAGFAITGEKFGGIAFSVRERFQWYSRFNQSVSEIMFMGKWAPYFDVKFDADSMMLPTDSSMSQSVEEAYASVPQLYSELFDNSELTMSWVREFNVSYGRQIVGNDAIKIYAGAGVKYLMGNSIMEVEANGGEFTGYTSISPVFGIDYGAAADTNPSTIEQAGKFLPRPVGRGWGIDLGASATIGAEERLKVGASLIDVGSITWDGNVYVANDDTLTSLISNGFNNYNIFTEAGEILAGENGLFTWNGEVKRKVPLPTHIRLGGSYELIVDKLNAGVDIIIPGNSVPGGYDRAIIAMGGEVQPFNWVRLSAGFTYGGNYDYNVPLGILFISGKGTYEAGIASRDALTFFTENRPHLSLATGFTRFRF